MTNFRRADLHVHSSASFDVPNLKALHPLSLFEMAMGNSDPARRMDYFALTDHDTMAGYQTLMRELDVEDRRLVIPAVEHTLKDPGIGFTIHVNLYWIHPEQYAELQRRVTNLDELIDFCDEAGILYQYNHPTWWERRELKHGLVDFRKIPGIASRFPVLELNAGRTARQNLITRMIAAEQRKGLTSSTDTHTGDVGRAHTLAAGDTAGEFMSAVWSGESEMSLHVITYDGLLDEAHSLIDQIMNPQGGSLAGRKASQKGQGVFEGMGAKLVGSRLVRDHERVNRSIRSVLRQASKPIMKLIMGNERRLENTLALSGLAPYAFGEPAPIPIPVRISNR